MRLKDKMVTARSTV